MRSTKEVAFIWLVLAMLLVQYAVTFSGSTPVPEASDTKKEAINAPAAFGKTHFIVGYPLADLPAQTEKHHEGDCPRSDGSISLVLFSPDDNPRNELLSLIEHEQESIKVAVFNFSDEKIAQALVDAYKKRKVKVEVIVDPTCLRDKNNKIDFLCRSRISVFVYNPAYNKELGSSCMHHKFALFSKNKGNKRLLWNGSLNFTPSAFKGNQENAIIFVDNGVVERYAAQYERLRSRSYHYGLGADKGMSKKE